MKVYGVYQGCIYEGGGVSSPLYLKKEDAIAAAEKEFEEEKQRHAAVYEGDEIGKEYEWKIDGERWTNSVDEICVLEYEVI